MVPNEALEVFFRLIQTLPTFWAEQIWILRIFIFCTFFGPQKSRYPDPKTLDVPTSQILDFPTCQNLDFPASKNLDFLASQNLDFPASKNSTRRLGGEERADGRTDRRMGGWGFWAVCGQEGSENDAERYGFVLA